MGRPIEFLSRSRCGKGRYESALRAQKGRLPDGGAGAADVGTAPSCYLRGDARCGQDGDTFWTSATPLRGWPAAATTDAWHIDSEAWWGVGRRAIGAKCGQAALVRGGAARLRQTRGGVYSSTGTWRRVAASRHTKGHARTEGIGAATAAATQESVATSVLVMILTGGSSSGSVEVCGEVKRRCNE